MARKDKPKGFTVNRREFLKSAGVVGTVTAAVSPPEVNAQGAASAAALGPGEVPVHLQVNGKRVDLMIEPRVTLLDALRMRADLTGNKRGCDRGACGACTMIVDGRAGLLLLDPGDRGSGQADPHRRRAGERRRRCTRCSRPSATRTALMCGFCTPGFIMASVALLEKNPGADARADPPRARRQHLPVRNVLAHLRSRFQREGGDPWLSDERRERATGAERGAGVPASERVGESEGRSPSARRTGCCAGSTPAQGGRGGRHNNRLSRRRIPVQLADAASVLGTPVKRLDGPDKVTGRAKYTFDISRPGMLYGRIVRSPHPHARIVSIDLSAAQKAPGVKAALAWRDPANPQRNTVMYQGDEIAAVAADTEEHAIDAARLVKVEYEVLPHVTVVDQALAGERAGGLHRRQRAPGAAAGERRSRRGLQAGRARRSKRRIRRTSSRTCASSRTARSASGTATI